MNEVIQIYVKIDGRTIEIPLYEGIDDFYLLAPLTNSILDGLRQDVKTWFTPEVYEKLNLVILVEDSDAVNAFAAKNNDKHIVALSRGLMLLSHNEIMKWIESPNFTEVYKLSDKNKPSFIEYLYKNMICFIIAHEIGHIVNGHVDARSGAFCYIDELTSEKEEENWSTQLREYDADCFATRICSQIRLGKCRENKELTICEFDRLGIVMLLTFNLLSLSRKQEFINYMDMDTAAIDHPHPGIRIHYCLVMMADELLTVWSEKDTKEIFSVVFDGIIRTDKYLFHKEKYKECIYSVAGTEKGAQHIMNLINSWNKVVDEYEKYAYIPVRRTDDLESYLVSVDDEGNVLIPNF